MSTNGRALDVRELPSFGFSHRALTWWGTMGLMAIEGTAFALAAMAYFYLRAHSTAWPMTSLPPDLFWGTLNTVLLVVSLYPNHRAKKAAEHYDVAGVRLWLSVIVAVGLLFTAIRVAEFAALNCRWDSNAYGSIVWMLLGLHTTHLVTDVYDSIVLDVLVFATDLDGKRFVDVSENSMYWNFVVFTWLPIYLVIYWGPRAL